MPNTNVTPIDADSGNPPIRRTTFLIRPMSDVVDERLDEQYSRVMEVAEDIEAAQDAWSRCGFVCGVEVGKQTAVHEANVQMHSLLKLAAETLRDIANRIEPPAIWQQGEDSMGVVSERLALGQVAA
jgi:hypothetical protein